MKELFTKKNLQATGFVTVNTVAAFFATGGKAFAQIRDGVNQSRPEGSPDELFTDGGVFQKIANLLLFLVGAVAVIMLIIGGIRYVLSAGDQNAVTAAKNTILYAIVGIVVAFLAYAAVNFVVTQLEA